MPDDKMKQVTVYLPETLHKALKHMAIDKGISLTNLIYDACLHTYLDADDDGTLDKLYDKGVL